MAVLLNDVCYSATVEFSCVSSIIKWVKFKNVRVEVLSSYMSIPMRKKNGRGL